MRKLSKKTQKKLLACLAFLEMTSWSPLFASPKGMHVSSGSATASSKGQGILEIHSGNKAILNWDHFSIEKGEMVRFIQTDKNSSVLNRVKGGDPSKIFGSLEANGKVFLINPNGILIGEKASINVGSFIASTFDILNEEFLRDGDIKFAGPSKASIVNLGTIKAIDGDVVMIAYRVDNQGAIEAKNGVAALASGEDVLLKPSGKERILIRPKRKDESAKSGEGITHSGHIEAIQAELKADGNAYTMAINVTGVIEARGITKIDGRIFLVAENGFNQFSGSAIAKNEDKSGGTVHVLGEIVSLRDKAFIDVSGEKLGGTVLIGGDFKGKNPEIPNAKHIYVGKECYVKADALENGNGGTIVFWGDESDHFYGKASAKGGSKSGDGGFIEVSSAGELRDSGNIDQKAPFGKDGVNYIDPDDVQVVAYGSVDSKAIFRYQEPPTPSFYKFFPKSKVAKIDTGLLASRLNANSVIIDVSTSPDPDGAGLIQIFNSIQWSSPNSLTLIGNKVVINGGSTRNDIIVGTIAKNAQGPMLEINAAEVIVGSSRHITNHNTILQAGSGDIVINAPTSLQVFGGNGSNSSHSLIKAQGKGNVQLNVGDLVLETGKTGSGAGALITAEDGDITIRASNDISLHASGDDARIATSGLGNINVKKGANIYLRAEKGSSSIETSNPNEAGGNINIAISGDVKLQGGSSIAASDAYIAAKQNGNVNISAKGDYSLKGGLSFSNTGSAKAYIGASVDSDSKGSLTLSGKSFTLQGGEGNSPAMLHVGNHEYRNSTGTISLSAIEDVVLVGGSSPDAGASIQTFGETGNNSISVNAGVLYLDNTLLETTRSPICIQTQSGDIAITLHEGLALKAGEQLGSEAQILAGGKAGAPGDLKITGPDLHEAKQFARPKGFERPMVVDEKKPEIVTQPKEKPEKKPTPKNSWAIFDEENPILTKDYVSDAEPSTYYCESFSRYLKLDEVQFLVYQAALSNSQLFYFNDVEELDWLRFYSILFTIRSENNTKKNNEYTIRRHVYFNQHIPTTMDAIAEEQ